jgi:mRNA-degrading endonuclease YafQ of YafQ-DinJ toxin-antitoxin module
MPTGAFLRDTKRLVKKDVFVADRIRDTLTRLSEDAFDPSLRTHPLRGQLSGRYACSAGFDLRIIFRLVQDSGVEKVLLLTAGSHEDVY